MASEIYYDRRAAYEYARRWAYGRNPAYLNFDGMGGDCTNFASQCIFAGCKVMNYTPVFGWYYINSSNRTPSWAGVQYLYNFLINNKGAGPYGRLAAKEELEAGDIIQLGNENGVFYHTPVVVDNINGEIFVAAHTYDAFYKPLLEYDYAAIRYIKIGARK